MQEYLAKSLMAKDQFLDSSAKIMYKLGISSSKIKCVFCPLLFFSQNCDWILYASLVSLLACCFPSSWNLLRLQGKDLWHLQHFHLMAYLDSDSRILQLEKSHQCGTHQNFINSFLCLLMFLLSILNLYRSARIMVWLYFFYNNRGEG